MKTTSDNPLALIEDAWNHAPHKLISLWDMIRFFPAEFYCLLHLLEQLTKPDRVRVWLEPEWEVKQLIRIIGSLEKYGRSWGLVLSEDRCGSLKEYLNQYVEPAPDAGILAQATFHVAKPLSPDVVGIQAQEILDTIDKELRQRKFTHIPSAKSKFFEKKRLFGSAVYEAFPSARADIRGAGNCLAVDLNTAAVFHLMRVVETGLRAVARRLRVMVVIGKSQSSGCPLSAPTCPLGKKRKVTKKVKLEFAQWQQIIDQIEKKIKFPAPRHRTISQERRVESVVFYKDAMSSFYCFKEIWRNHVMHSRKNYDATEALRTCSLVRNFMQRLAKQVSEV